jgi:type IX secretion system PorP/SprF family membrane protein
MKRIFTGTVVVMMVTWSAMAQQDPQYSQNMFNKLPMNPAYAGSNDAVCATALYRNQWVDFEGAPKTVLFNIELPVSFLKGGAGLTIMHDELGFEKTIGAKLAYAYRANLGSGKLGLGVDVGFMQKSIDGNFKFNDPNDPNIPFDKVSATSPDFSGGIYYHTDKFYLGLSSTHLVESDLEFGKFTTTLKRHYYGMTGMSFDLTPAIVLKPSLLVKTDAASYQFDLNTNLVFNNRFWGGLSYRYTDAIVALVGMNITDNLKFGYAYDVTTSALNGVSNGTHEIMLGYCFNIQTSRPFYMNRNVRFL